MAIKSNQTLAVDKIAIDAFRECARVLEQEAEQARTVFSQVAAYLDDDNNINGIVAVDIRETFKKALSLADEAKGKLNTITTTIGFIVEKLGLQNTVVMRSSKEALQRMDRAVVDIRSLQGSK